MIKLFAKLYVFYFLTDFSVGLIHRFLFNYSYDWTLILWPMPIVAITTLIFFNKGIK